MGAVCGCDRGVHDGVDGKIHDLDASIDPVAAGLLAPEKDAAAGGAGIDAGTAKNLAPHPRKNCFLCVVGKHYGSYVLHL